MENTEKIIKTINDLPSLSLCYAETKENGETVEKSFPIRYKKPSMSLQDKIFDARSELTNEAVKLEDEFKVKEIDGLPSSTLKAAMVFDFQAANKKIINRFFVKMIQLIADDSVLKYEEKQLLHSDPTDSFWMNQDIVAIEDAATSFREFIRVGTI
jgi:hypothetical protein